MLGETTSLARRPIGDVPAPRPGMFVLVMSDLTCPLLGAGRTALVGDLAGAADDVVDEAVVLGLLGGEPAVPVGVGLDLLERLAGVLADQLEQHLLDV